jgi:hypothetical protein
MGTGVDDTLGAKMNHPLDLVQMKGQHRFGPLASLRMQFSMNTFPNGRGPTRFFVP